MKQSAQQQRGNVQIIADHDYGRHGDNILLFVTIEYKYLECRTYCNSTSIVALIFLKINETRVQANRYLQRKKVMKMKHEIPHQVVILARHIVMLQVILR